MKRIGILISLVLILLGGLAGAGYAWAFSSEGFYEVEGEIYDDWAVCRTRSFGEDGFYQLTPTDFRPVIAFESLGENADIAYSLGQEFAAEYPDVVERAEAVFNYVRDRVRYTTDIDLFGYEEFAQNADELVSVMVEQNGRGYGDCEDSTVYARGRGCAPPSPSVRSIPPPLSFCPITTKPPPFSSFRGRWAGYGLRLRDEITRWAGCPVSFSIPVWLPMR